MKNDRAVASRIILPVFTRTETCDASDSEAIYQKLPAPYSGYHYKPFSETFAHSNYREQYCWNQYPLILNSDGAPWQEANLFLLNLIEMDWSAASNMATYHRKAADLVDFRKFIDDKQLDFKVFPKRQRERPTYAYRTHLHESIHLGEMSSSTARGRISTLIQFYSWMIQEGICEPENPPWKTKETNISFSDDKGFTKTKNVTSTDLSIRVPRASSPFHPTIADDGKLRPLEAKEQEALLYTLKELQNTTLALIHYVALLTGARIQTVLTMRVRHVRLKLDENVDPVSLPVGPGTGIDTKRDKNFSIYIPRNIYERLRVYSYSPEASKRRKISGKDHEDQYLFLTRSGNPMYMSKQDKTVVALNSKTRYIREGATVRQFIGRRVIPIVRKKLGMKNWRYEFHDLRATYGMNQLEQQMLLVDKGYITPTDALRTVQRLLAHENMATTLRYLNYRKELLQVKHLQLAYECHLSEMIDKAIGQQP